MIIQKINKTNGQGVHSTHMHIQILAYQHKRRPMLNGLWFIPVEYWLFPPCVICIIIVWHLYSSWIFYSFVFNFSLPVPYFRYRPAYKAFRDDSSFNFMVFFFIFFFQLLVMIWQTIGVRGSGYCGFITALTQFDGSVLGVLIGLLTLVVACSFGICAGGSLMLLTKVCPPYSTLWLT